MNPEILLSAAIAALRQSPPAGLNLDDVDSFFERNRAQLLEIVRKALPAGRIEPAFTRLREEHRLGRLLLEAVGRHLRGEGVTEGAELAELLDGLDDHVAYESGVLFPYLRGQLPQLAEALDHAREEHELVAEQLFALASALRRGRRYEGPAIEAMLHHFEEEEAQIVDPALAAGLARTPAGNPGRLTTFSADIERLAEQLAPTPPPVAGEPTPWGGRRGRALRPGEIDQNTRVVTEQGEHGLVTEVHAIVVTSLFGGRRSDDDVHYTYTLKLDSGREAVPRGQLYQELAWPTDVVPDVQVGDRWTAPAEVWSQILGRYRDISHYADKAEGARKPENKRQWQKHAAHARQEFLELVRLLSAWRAAHPEAPIEGLRAHLWRRVGLEAQANRSEAEQWELALLRRLPADWDTLFKPGSPVTRLVIGLYGRQQDTGWTLTSLDGQMATLTRGQEQATEPLWLLKADDRAPLVETFTEPRYLRDLAAEMLVEEGGYKPYPNRGAAARAVKTFLAENGVPVSTHVNQGSMVTSIDLRAPSGAWSPEVIARMQALLPGINVFNERQSSFEPWATDPEPRDSYADYPGKGAGIRIPAEHLARFAAILAAAMKAEGQALNALGERRLTSASPARANASNRGGATAEQRASAAEGCRDLDFELPGYGRIRVVCGEQGRRDVWNIIFHADVRYGYNGGRWARGQRPPEPVLAAIREHGVTAFGG